MTKTITFPKPKLTERQKEFFVHLMLVGVFIELEFLGYIAVGIYGLEYQLIWTIVQTTLFLLWLNTQYEWVKVGFRN
jgi:hypothetical protein